ncbi:MAG: hypothetical protein RL607_1487 [Bacteroidota bacterium]|jgi:hypothetical protein
MTKKLLYFITLILVQISTAQTISIVGTGVNGWPPTNGPEITLSTTDNIVYTISNLAVSTGFVKFRQNLDWAVNWGSNTFPNGTGTQGGQDIPTLSGTYTVTFNRLTGAYSFAGTATGSSIDLWGPAVDAQLGYGGPGVSMTTSDDVNYSLANFVFTSGNAYFRQNGNNNLTYGSTAFPSGTAVASGPSIPINGGEWYVTFNRVTGVYNFDYPQIGILGSALNGWTTDTDLITSDGFNYHVQVSLTTGAVKFRKNNAWGIDWGGTNFPSGTGTMGGPDINIPTTSTYYVQFEPLTGNYTFTDLLSTSTFNKASFTAYPNPSNSTWTFEGNSMMYKIELFDLSGKLLYSVAPSSTTFTLQNNDLSQGIYMAQIHTASFLHTIKLIKN